MSMKVSLLRCSRLLPQSRQIPILRPHLGRNLVLRRPFHAYPPLREVASGSSSPNSASAEPSSSAEQPEPTPESSDSPVKAEETSSTSKHDIPPPPPKRNVDPKDHELAELKVNTIPHHDI
jgi:hypothetical protein